MADLAILTPSRGRPDRFAELVDAVRRTAAFPVDIWCGLDFDDPSDYSSSFGDGVFEVRDVRRSLSGWTNHLAKLVLESPNPPRYLASLGDDHRPRSGAWDADLVEAIEQLDGPGFAYGNDLYQGSRVPTAWVASSEAVRALGWAMLPACEHMYVDSAILELGKAADRIVYRPDVVIEHVHPIAGKAGWDDSYRSSNSSERYEHDRAAFEAWKLVGLTEDVAKVEALVYAR